MVIDLEKYENMPFRESKSAFCVREYGWIGYHVHKGSWGISKNPYKIEQRVLKNNIGKSFALAFSYYCKKVKPRYQDLFLKNFQEKYWRYYRGFGLDYIIDENGNIQDIREEKPKKEISIKFNNYQIEIRHKLTGHPRKHFEDVYSYREIDTKKYKKYYYWAITRKIDGVFHYFEKDKFLHLEYVGKYGGKTVPLHQRYTAKESDFIPVCISGSIKYFDSKQNREFQRYNAELEKSKKSIFKNEREQQRKVIELGLLSKFSISKSAKKELKKKMEAERREKERLAKEEMKLTLQRKGFRPNAFTNKPE